MSITQFYKGYAITYSTFGGIVEVNSLGITWFRNIGAGEIDSFDMAKKFIDGDNE